MKRHFKRYVFVKMKFGSLSFPVTDDISPQCIIAYLSDFYFIGVASRTLGLKRFSKGHDALAMSVCCIMVLRVAME